MKIEDFIAKFDLQGSVVLLEGKREVPDHLQAKLQELGRKITQSSKYMRFRSGNAKGADFYFSAGVCEVDPSRFEAITPYNDHRKKESFGNTTHSIESLNLTEEEEVIYQTKKNRKVEKLVDRFVAGEKDRFSMKAAYLIRDTVKVIGAKNIPPSKFAIFYDDLEAPITGGTGHTMKVCQENDIPYIDQRTWLTWLQS